MRLEDHGSEDLRRFDTALLSSGRPARFGLAGGTAWQSGATANDALFLLSGSAVLLAQTPMGPFDLCTLSAPCLLGLSEVLLIGGKRQFQLDLKGRTAFVGLSADELRPLVLAESLPAASFRRVALGSMARGIRETNEGLLRFFTQSDKLRDRFAGLKFEDLIAEASEGGGLVSTVEPLPALAPTPGQIATAAAGSEPHLTERQAEWDEAGSVFQLAGMDPALFPALGLLVREYRSGAVLAKAGDKAEEVFLVLDGRVRVSKNISGTGEEALGFGGKGQFLGEMALIDNSPRSADLIAHEGPVRVAVIKREPFQKLVIEAPEGSALLVGGLVVSLAKRMKEAIQRHISLYIMAGGFT
jgi:hypothetical protein